MDEQRLRAMAGRVVAVDGVVGVTLGGSRARGDHAPGSDTDVGIYYRSPLDVGALRQVARAVAGPSAELTEPGGWGPWVDGGGWLDVDGEAVDWIYRDLDRVRACWADAREGRYAFHHQVGHPLGVPSFAYAGELALAVVLADPGGGLSALREEMDPYPPALADAVVDGLWEARFLLSGAAKAAARADTAYVAGCLFRVVGLCAHAVCAHARRWVVNDKGLVATAARLPGAPEGFGDDARAVLASLGATAETLSRALERAGALVEATAASTQASGPGPSVHPPEDGPERRSLHRGAQHRAR